MKKLTKVKIAMGAAVALTGPSGALLVAVTEGGEYALRRAKRRKLNAREIPAT